MVVRALRAGAGPQRRSKAVRRREHGPEPGWRTLLRREIRPHRGRGGRRALVEESRRAVGAGEEKGGHRCSRPDEAPLGITGDGRAGRDGGVVQRQRSCGRRSALGGSERWGRKKTKEK
jgi:hypothetical protein